MTQKAETTNGYPALGKGETPYDRAALGFRNYWYPALLAKHVKERRPKALKLLGDEVVFLRRQGKVYALADECPHRGTRLSRGKHEFPGTPTIACRYHGWVFDVTSGICVAALTDGPDSPVVGKVRVKTYPVEVRKGIVWIWMGKGAPVPLEEDVPPIVLRKDTCIAVMVRPVHADWRFHAENVGMGHVPMLHRDTLLILNTQMPAYITGFGTQVGEVGEDGEWLMEIVKGAKQVENYPGLGSWPRPQWRPWRRKGDVKYMGKDHLPKLIGGVRYPRVSLRLPGTIRVTHAPITGCLSYEWWYPSEEGWYTYFILVCYWPKNVLDRLWYYAKFFLFGRPTHRQFTAQDLPLISDATKFARRHGDNPPSPLYRPDGLIIAWREFCNTRARGEAAAPAARKREKEPAAHEGS